MRGCTVALAFVLLAYAFWVIPWLPFGLTVEDYSAPVATSVGLGTLCALLAVAYTLVWAPQFKNESPREFVRALFGSRRLIRGPGQFMHRLDLECRRTRRDRRRAFTLVVVRLDHAPVPDIDVSQLREATSILARSAVRSEDIVGDSGDDEVWLLALGAPQPAIPSLLGRLSSAFREMIPEREQDAFQGFGLGAASFGPDGEKADVLLNSARRAAAAASGWWQAAA
jgi:GGDEF domain-containing protein